MENKTVGTNELLFAKMNESVIIPSKKEENAGYDVYANFEEAYIAIKPHETVMIPTGLVSVFSEDYVAILKERGSTGSKGIGQRCGVIDSGYRGEWFVPLTNHGDKTILIAKEEMLTYEEQTKEKVEGNFRKTVTDTVIFSQDKKIGLATKYVVYPYAKAIAQAIMVEVPKLEVKEIEIDDVMKYQSERGTGKLGDSGK